MAEIRKIVLIPDRTLKGTETQEVIEAYYSALIFLDLYNLCDFSSALPKPGGLLDQDSLYVHLMRWTIQCRENKRQLDEAKKRFDSGAVQLS